MPERIEHENGVYVCRREPKAEPVEDAGVIVLFTHDFAKAAEAAWPVWCEHHEGRRLGRPQRVWWRRVNWDMCGEGWAYTWFDGKPGTRGIAPGVLFALPPYTEDCLTPQELAFERGEVAS